MYSKAGRRRLRAAAAVTMLLTLVGLWSPAAAVAVVFSGAPPAANAPAAGSPSALPATPSLPDVPLDVTDGYPLQTLYQMAISLSSSAGTAGLLQSRIGVAQRALDRAAVQARQASQAAADADARQVRAANQANAAGAAYASLKGALKKAALFMYIAGPAYVTVNPQAGDKLAYAADYADTALTPGGLLETRRFEASLRARALAQATAARREADHQSQLASDALNAERNAEAMLETELAALNLQSGPALSAEHTTLANQAGQELLSPSSLEFTPMNPLPSPLATANVAISWVFSELGKPYLWGGTGPAAFDCSGLMQYAWHQAGVDIPRVAADQDSWTVPVPLSQLLPGDLVFFGRSDIHHVGMYIGDGLMINAPHTGDVVRVSSIWWSDLAGFGRVHDPNTPVPVHATPSVAQPAAPEVVQTAGAVPSQAAPPPGWIPQPGETTPISIEGLPDPGGTDASTTTTTTTPESTTTTSIPSTTTVPSGGWTTTTTVLSGS